jgi:hypothetical protein
MKASMFCTFDVSLRENGNSTFGNCREVER